MSAPNIKIYIVPEESNSDNDIGTKIGPTEAKLIERACDGTLVGTKTWQYPYEPEYMIKFTPISEGSNVYEIDVGPNAYHDTNKINYFSDPSFGMAANFVRDAGGGLFNTEDILFHRREYAPNSGLSRPIFLQFQLFALKESQFLGLPGSGQSTLSVPFTYIPRYGSYSFNFQEDGFPSQGANYFGDITPVYMEYNSSIGRYDWGGKLNYTINLVNKRITFDQDFFNEYLQEGAFEIYAKFYIYRSGNNHSNTLSGVDSSGFSFSGELIYYALPNFDIVETQNPLITTPGFSPTVLPSLIKTTGLVEFNNNPVDYPPNGNLVRVNTYNYHRWIRLTNDFTDEALFHSYFNNGISGERKIEVFNFENNNIGSQGHYQNPAQNINQEKQLYVNYSWFDIKIVNEITNNISDPPNFLDVFLDFVPRGNLSDDTPEDEQIERGIGGLINNLRPWDHQEGGTEETDKSCFARVTKTFSHLRNAPNPGGIEVYETNPMSIMNAAQAWRIREWYEDTPFFGINRIFKLDVPDNIMATNQTGNTLLMTAGQIVYGRIVYILYDGNQIEKVNVASAPKRFTASLKGEFIQ